MKYFKFLFSGAFMGVLLLVFAIVIGYATFIENDYGATEAKFMVYNAAWFEILLLLMVVNFTGMIVTHRLYTKARINILIIHLALIIVIVGAGITRYVGFEGMMHIRNGQTTNLFQSTDTYLQMYEKNGSGESLIDEKVMLSAVRDNLYQDKIKLNDSEIEVDLTKYMPNAQQVIEKAENGDAFITLVAGGQDGRHQFTLKEGESKILHNLGISFGDTTQTNFTQIIQENGHLFIKLPEPVLVKRSDQDTVGYMLSGFNPLALMSVHTVNNVSFVVKEFIPSGKYTYQEASSQSESGVPVVKMNVNGQHVYLLNGREQDVTVNNTIISVKVAAKKLELPFDLKLEKFDLERYPGSMSPSSFASDVILIDKERNVNMPFRIYMNNILSYRGYRFYQSSYDQDEQGTILSVNSDYWGTTITYIGYFILFGSLLASFFTKKTRFKRILQQIKEIHDVRKKSLTSVLILMISLFVTPFGLAQGSVNEIDVNHAKKFGELLVQNKEGRIEPLNTAASKILMKIYKKSSFEGLIVDQVYLGMLTDYNKWSNAKIIKVDNIEVQRLIGINETYARFSDFIDVDGKYKLNEEVQKAHMKKPAVRNTYDKALINIDERANVFYLAINGNFLNIFPNKQDSTNKWLSPGEFHKLAGHGTLKGDMYENYQKYLKMAIRSGDYRQADSVLSEVKEYQSSAGANIIPSSSKIKMELFYNEANVFKNLFPFYMMIGLVMVGLFFFQTFNPSREFRRIYLGIQIVVAVLFVVHTFGLGLRWYIAGHAPWSNGYESMIYISWATILAGFIFMKKSPITLGVSAVLAGITLLTAHMSWMNPEITNLVPVLKSYWLTIHVATITASYGFLALGCLLGFVNLCMLIFKSKSNFENVDLVQRELTLIIELTLIVGLVFLVIGNFLGGIWANESWGRYWGWDPKETWTLVTVIVYSFTLHTSMIPKLRTTFMFNFLAMVSFGAVLMTYFGVNYFLSGLHSYAGGDTVEIPSFVNYTLLIILFISSLAAYNAHKLSQSSIE